jgi:hypothetical protein
VYNKICQGTNIKFLFCSLDPLQYHFLEKTAPEHFLTSNNLNIYKKEIYPKFDIYPEYQSRLCTHPNERGYEFIAENIFNIIKENFPLLINSNRSLEFKQEWRGLKQW